MVGSTERANATQPEVTVYEALSEHQCSLSPDAVATPREKAEVERFAAWLKEFHRWKDLYASEFKIDLPPVAFCIKATRSNCFGYFRPGHNEFGMTREIAINRRYMEMREPWQILGTLLHEILHAWQDAFGLPGKRNYHNAEFRARAQDYGLIVNSAGITEYAPQSRFLDLLKKHGVNVPEVDSPVHVPKALGSSTLKKWSCNCTIVRVGTSRFSARCNLCGNEFERADQ